MSDVVETFNNILILDTLEVVALGTGDNRIRDLVDLGCCKDELHMFWRLFEGFEESIESAFGEHVYLIDDVHFIRCLSRLELSSLDHVTDIIHPRIGRGIDFDNIKETPILGIATVLAYSAGISIGGERETIHPLGKYASYSGFPGPAGTMKKIGSDGTVLEQGILENLSNEGLSEKGVKIFGSVRLVECHYRGERTRKYMDMSIWKLDKKQNLTKKIFLRTHCFFEKYHYI